MFSTPHKYDPNFIEGTVVSVDHVRFVCAVKTNRGQLFKEVIWLKQPGSHDSPELGNRVLVSTSLTYPVILGILPKIGINSETDNSVTGASSGVDTGNSSSIGEGYGVNPEKPSDFLPGDKVFTTEGGGIFAVLRNGSIVLRSSFLAQILISKFNDLVRVVGRNYERISDLGQQSVVNAKGRMYEFLGWDRSFERSKNSAYELKDIIGDVAAGEVYKTNPDANITPPVKDGRVRKYSLENHQGAELMTEVLTEDGKIVVIIRNGGTTTVTHDNSKWETVTTNGTTSTITILPGSITLNHDNKSTMLMNADGIKMDHHSGHFVYIDTSGVHTG